jgi:Flp pilus assembly pilin Flp
MEGVQMKEVLLRLWKEESGQDLTEYALLLVLVTLLAFASLQSLSTKINTVYDTAANDLNVTTTTT